VSNQPQYRPTWADELAYDPQESLRLLTAAGCERGDDGIFSCDGQRLSFRYATLSGDLRRQEFFEIIQAQLRDVGVELRAAFADAPVLFGDRLTGRRLRDRRVVVDRRARPLRWQRHLALRRRTELDRLLQPRRRRPVGA
jgi:ABC-type transport system substrate-binding protein